MSDAQHGPDSQPGQQDAPGDAPGDVTGVASAASPHPPAGVLFDEFGLPADPVAASTMLLALLRSADQRVHGRWDIPAELHYLLSPLATADHLDERGIDVADLTARVAAHPDRYGAAHTLSGHGPEVTATAVQDLIADQHRAPGTGWEGATAPGLDRHQTQDSGAQGPADEADPLEQLWGDQEPNTSASTSYLLVGGALSEAGHPAAALAVRGPAPAGAAAVVLATEGWAFPEDDRDGARAGVRTPAQHPRRREQRVYSAWTRSGMSLDVVVERGHGIRVVTLALAPDHPAAGGRSWLGVCSHLFTGRAVADLAQASTTDLVAALAPGEMRPAGRVSEQLLRHLGRASTPQEPAVPVSEVVARLALAALVQDVVARTADRAVAAHPDLHERARTLLAADPDGAGRSAVRDMLFAGKAAFGQDPAAAADLTEQVVRAVTLLAEAVSHGGQAGRAPLPRNLRGPLHKLAAGRMEVLTQPLTRDLVQAVNELLGGLDWGDLVRAARRPGSPLPGDLLPGWVDERVARAVGDQACTEWANLPMSSAELAHVLHAALPEQLPSAELIGLVAAFTGHPTADELKQAAEDPQGGT